MFMAYKNTAQCHDWENNFKILNLKFKQDKKMFEKTGLVETKEQAKQQVITRCHLG